MIHASSDKGQDLPSVCQKLLIRKEDLVSAEQIHADGIALVSAKDKGSQIPKVDALITAEKSVPLTVRTADCAPILIHDPVTEVLALVHAGRCGTELEITYKTVQKLKGAFGSEPKDLKVIVGPCIDKCCYPMDIREKNLEQLARVGVPKENIAVDPDCTCCNSDKYYSYRGDGPETGRMFLVARL
ncbi:polyphenol oxidase family protein [Candidatus Margulisiibacteriota bacterium]